MQSTWYFFIQQIFTKHTVINIGCWINKILESKNYQDYHRTQYNKIHSFLRESNHPKNKAEDKRLN